MCQGREENQQKVHSLALTAVGIWDSSPRDIGQSPLELSHGGCGSWAFIYQPSFPTIAWEFGGCSGVSIPWHIRLAAYMGQHTPRAREHTEEGGRKSLMCRNCPRERAEEHTPSRSCCLSPTVKRVPVLGERSSRKPQVRAQHGAWHSARLEFQWCHVSNVPQSSEAPQRYSDLDPGRLPRGGGIERISSIWSVGKRSDLITQHFFHRITDTLYL